MAFLNVQNIGEYGIITDVVPWQLPVNALTGGQNVRIRDGRIHKFRGHEEFVVPPADWDGGGVTNTTDQVYWAIPSATGTDYLWIYCGLNDVRVTDGTTDKEITRASGDYTATASTVNWTGGLIGGIPVINNGVDDPQEWDNDFATPGLLTDLSNWPANTTCKVMRVFKNYLVAMDVTKSSGTRFPTLVKWSDGATLGNVPGSWDETDPSTDAGETDLAEAVIDISVGAILDGAPLRDNFIIYKDDSTWGMRFIGGSNVMQFFQISKTASMLTRRCVAEFQGKHFVFGNGDVYVHDGNTVTSIIDAKRKRFLFADIDSTNYENSFCYHNKSETEVWLCYPEDGNSTGLCNKALVWNYTYNSWMVRELPDAAHISAGTVDTSSGADIWSTSDGTWETWTVPWSQIAFNPTNQSPLICSTKLLKGDSTDQFDGSNFTSKMERQYLPIGGDNDIVRIKRVYPRMEGSGSVQISIGTHMNVEDPVSYKSAVTFTPGTDRKIDVNATGAYMAIKIESSGNVAWSISGYQVEYELTAQR